MTFQPGQSGNPAGRPKGSRDSDSAAYLKALRDEIERRGGKNGMAGWFKGLKDEQLLVLARNRVPRKTQDEVDVGPTLEELLLNRVRGAGKAD